MPAPALPREGTAIRSILERFRARREAVLPTRIQRVLRDRASFPLSDGQERLWFIDQLLPGNTAYSITAAVRFEGPLSPSLLELALAEIVRRHETLRTTFRAEGDTPAQVVAPAETAKDFVLRVVDLSALRESR